MTAAAATEITASQLHDDLEASGTGKEKLAVIRRVIDANPEATGEDGYRALVAADPDVRWWGTRDKAGKMVFGEGFTEPERQPPKDEVKQLREENAKQAADIKRLKAERDELKAKL